MTTNERSMNPSGIDCEDIENPLVRKIVERYNELVKQGISCGTMNDYNKGNHTKHSKGGSGGCYVTTSCLDALDLPKDSLEMKAIKVLTIDHILKSLKGKKDYVLYGRRAPRIVEAIESRSDSQNIWRRVYGKLKEITESVLSEDYEKGYRDYKELVSGLERQYA